MKLEKLSMNKILLVDFGATHIKSTVYSAFDDRWDSFNKIISPQNVSDIPGQFVVPQARLTKIFKDICEMHKKDGYEAIFIASQMHGFVAVDANNKPLTDYISWQDQRGQMLDIENFSKITGMKNLVIIEKSIQKKQLILKGELNPNCLRTGWVNHMNL